MLLRSIARDAQASERDIMSGTTRDGGGAMPPSENHCRSERPLECNQPFTLTQSSLLDNSPPLASWPADYARLRSKVVSPSEPTLKSSDEIVARRKCDQ